MFEYLIRRYSTVQERLDGLNKLGAQGWELVAVNETGYEFYEFYFKRRVA